MSRRWRPSGNNSELRTHAVGKLKANPFGLSDMHGNVWEWVQDDWDPAFYRQFLKDAPIDPSIPFSADSPRVDRGGRWMLAPCSSRSSSRTHDFPARRHNYTGFRVVLPVDAVRQAVKQSSNMDAKTRPAG